MIGTQPRTSANATKKGGAELKKMKLRQNNNVPFNDVTPIDESAEAESVDLTVKVESRLSEE